jgi:hypothetical protein
MKNLEVTANLMRGEVVPVREVAPGSNYRDQVTSREAVKAFMAARGFELKLTYDPGFECICYEVKGV